MMTKGSTKQRTEFATCERKEQNVKRIIRCCFEIKTRSNNFGLSPDIVTIGTRVSTMLFSNHPCSKLKTTPSGHGIDHTDRNLHSIVLQGKIPGLNHHVQFAKTLHLQFHLSVT